MRGSRERDLEAVRDVLAGRQAAFETIVAGYQRLVASVAYRVGVPREEIEDVVSEIFVKIYRNLHHYSPEFGLSTWIYRISTNHCLDHMRRRRPERDRVEMPVSLPDGSPSADGRFEQQERALLVRQALKEVPEKYRVPLVLMHVEGLGIEEIARILSLPAGTVKTRLSRGRARLAEIIRRRWPDLMAQRVVAGAPP